MFAIKAPVTVSVVASAQAQKCEKKATWVFARISSSLDFELYCLFFLRFVGDERWWNFGRYPRKNLLFEKRESKSTSCLKTSENNRQTKIYTSSSTERISSKSRCRSRRPQTCANSRHYSRWEFVFFISCFLPQSLVSAPKDTQKLRRDFTPEETKEKGTCCFLLFNNNNTRETVRFFFSN